MPIVEQLDDQQEDQQQQGQSLSGSPQSGIVSGGNSQSSGQPQTQGQPTRSGSFTNLRQYLDAAQGEGQRMARDISSEARVQGQEAVANLQGLQDQARQQIQQSGTEFGQQQQNMVNQVQTAPEQVDVQGFRNLMGAQYQGPQDLSQIENYGQVAGDINRAQQLGGQTQTESGRNTLLQQTYNRPKYTQGMRSLDQYLVQNDPGARQEFSQLRDYISGINPQLEAAKSQIASEAQDRATQTQQAAEAARNAIGLTPEGLYAETGAIPEFQRQLQESIDTQRDLYPTQQQAVADRISKGQFTEQELANLGISSGQNLYNTMSIPQNYLSAFDPRRAVSEDQYARAQALQNLAGLSESITPYTSESGYAGTNASQNLDIERLKAAIQKSKEDYLKGYESSTPFLNVQDQGGQFSNVDMSRIRNMTPAQLQAEVNRMKEAGQSGGSIYAANLAALENWKQKQGLGNVASVYNPVAIQKKGV